MREHQLFRRKKGSDGEWKSNTKSKDLDYIVEVYKLNTTDPSLNEFEFKIETVN